MRCLISHPKTHESSIAAPFELTSGGSKQKCQMIISSLGVYQNKIRKKSNTTVSTFDIHIHSMYIYNIHIWCLDIIHFHYIICCIFKKSTWFTCSMAQKSWLTFDIFPLEGAPRTDSPPVPSPRVISPPDGRKNWSHPEELGGEVGGRGRYFWLQSC